jgi:hypothetical protein
MARSGIHDFTRRNGRPREDTRTIATGEGGYGVRFEVVEACKSWWLGSWLSWFVHGHVAATRQLSVWLYQS